MPSVGLKLQTQENLLYSIETVYRRQFELSKAFCIIKRLDFPML